MSSTPRNSSLHAFEIAVRNAKDCPCGTVCRSVRLERGRSFDLHRRRKTIAWNRAARCADRRRCGLTWKRAAMGAARSRGRAKRDDVPVVTSAAAPAMARASRRSGGRGPALLRPSAEAAGIRGKMRRACLVVGKAEGRAGDGRQRHRPPRRGAGRLARGPWASTAFADRHVLAAILAAGSRLLTSTSAASSTASPENARDREADVDDTGPEPARALLEADHLGHRGQGRARIDGLQGA